MSYDIESLQLPRYKTGEPISIVLVCRNKVEALPHVLSALSRNTLLPNRVVLSDDASTDNSIELFKDLCARMELNAIVIRHPAHNNYFRLNTLRNDGIEACEDGLVIILDADHVPAPTHIQTHVNLHLKNEKAVLSTGPRFEYAYPDCSGPVNFMWGFESVGMMQASATKPIISWTTVLASNLGMAKQAFQQLGMFDPRYDGNYGFDDVDFTYRAWHHGYFFAASLEAYVVHIPHPPFRKRRGDINKKKFEQKYGLKMSYPAIVDRMVRNTWHDYYQKLLTQPDWDRNYHETHASPEKPVTIKMIDFETINSKFLFYILLERLKRKLWELL